MFAIGFFLEREPDTLAELAGNFRLWLQNVGALAAICLAVFVSARLLQQRGWMAAKRNPHFAVLAGSSFCLYLAYFLSRALGLRVTDPASPAGVGSGLLAVAGSLAILAVLTPI